MPTPRTHLDARFSSPGATPTPWEVAEPLIADAEVWWITTVRPDGRPHVTPLLAVWDDGALHVTTGPEEQKAVNLRSNDQVALTTGVNTQDDGLDIVVHGRAVRVTDTGRLEALAEAWVATYGEDWRFRAQGDAFVHDDQPEAVAHAFVHDDQPEAVAHVFAVVPTEVFGFGKGATFSQTRWRF